ncbi:MAG TPA: flagellar hook-associated protein FlgL [Noviherbaspirillum sp.]|nr:flagellar hook-associated protein FlgL [Noviherbaspirillum sp.]
MRISTNSLFETGSSRVGDLQNSLFRTQEQLAAGRRILVPSDDPVAAAQALEVTQAQEVNSQLAVNRRSAKDALNLEEHVLQSVTGLIQDAQTLVTSAGNGTLNDSERKFIATELRGRFDDLMGLANTKDGAGNFLFAGFRTTEQPFAQTADGARYDGDQGQRMLQVGPMRQIAVNDAGSAVFNLIPTGNGTSVTSAGNFNTGSGVVSSATLTGTYSGNTYAIVFTSPTEYRIENQTSGTVVSSNNPYVSGQAIAINNEYRLDITGTPAVNDTFSVAPSANQSVFSTLTRLINTLETPVSDAAGRARLTNELNAARNNLNNSLDSILTTRAAVGSRLKEIDSLDIQGEGRDLVYAQSLSALQDLDYTQAITELSKKKIMLEAAQQAFVQTSRLSLFSYM